MDVQLIGDVPGKRFSSKSSRGTSSRIRRARNALSAGNPDVALRNLAPLTKGGHAEAIYLTACVSLEGESESTFARRHIKQLTQAAKNGFAPAMFALAVYSDTGEHVKMNKRRAAKLFARTAKLGHPHAQWIHAMDLIYGRNGVKRNCRLGITYLKKSLAARFAGAIATTASFYAKGECGFPKDAVKARILRRQLRDGDVLAF